MTYDEKILNYKMTEQDEVLRDTANIIIRTYNGSYKPHLIDIQNDSETFWTTVYSPFGFSFASGERGSLRQVYTTDEKLSDFVEHVFLTVGGCKNITMKQVCESPAVKHALVKHFDFPTDIDFQSEGFIPILFCGDNDFVIYYFNDDIWSKYNIVDKIAFKKKNILKELL